MTSDRSSPTSNSPTVSGQRLASVRPSFARANTQVRIVDEQSPVVSPSSDPGHGGVPAHGHADGLTLADLSQLMEVEQAREQHRARSGSSLKPLVCELPPFHAFIAKHVALVLIERSAMREHCPENLSDLIEGKKNTFWGKLFKGTNEKEKKKKQAGVFGVPLDLLVERSGTDSLLGQGPHRLRVPSFVDDVISAMRQMGTWPWSGLESVAFC